MSFLNFLQKKCDIEDCNKKREKDRNFCHDHLEEIAFDLSKMTKNKLVKKGWRAV